VNLKRFGMQLWIRLWESFRDELDTIIQIVGSLTMLIPGFVERCLFFYIFSVHRKLMLLAILNMKAR